MFSVFFTKYLSYQYQIIIVFQIICVIVKSKINLVNKKQRQTFLCVTKIESRETKLNIYFITRLFKINYIIASLSFVFIYVKLNFKEYNIKFNIFSRSSMQHKQTDNICDLWNMTHEFKFCTNLISKNIFYLPSYEKKPPN